MKRVKSKTSFSGTRILAIFLLPIPTRFSNFVDGPAPMITFQINHDSLLANEWGIESWIYFWERAIEHDRFKSTAPDLNTFFAWMILTEQETGDALLFL